MAEPIVSFVLETFRDLLMEEANSLGGVDGQVEELIAELERMKSFLKDADARQNEAGNNSLRTWIRQVRNLAYRAQDVLEKHAYVVEDMPNRNSGIKKQLLRFACILNKCTSLHEVGSEITNIKTEMVNLRESLRTYGINPTGDTERAKEADEKQRFLRQTFPELEDEGFVGMVDDINKLVSVVIDETKHDVVSIYGMAGSGKTTMARKIYNHPRVKQAFGRFAWVCVTQNCETITVLKDFLKQLIGLDRNNSSFRDLVRDISGVLQRNKCLVVLDDIWNVNDWQVLSFAFVNIKGQSKVLLTTRKEKIASVGFPHQQRLLTEEEGLELLQKKAFCQNDIKDLQSEDSFGQIGREMVLKCGGLPLAISALGGILRTRSFIKEWEAINKDIDSNLNQGLGDGNGAMSKVLALSYYDLPYYLKPCFLYMTTFREGELIILRKLYHLWIAEDMVSAEFCSQSETLMDVAERFLKELSSRSMVQVHTDPILGRLESCSLHDLMRHLCLKVAREEEFSESIEMDFRDGKNGHMNSFANHNVRRLAILLSTDADDKRCLKPFDQITTPFVRALSLNDVRYMVYSNPGSVDSQVASAFRMAAHTVEVAPASNFKLLRILDFKDCTFHEEKLLYSGFGQLSHLRYVSLFGSHLPELPAFVGNLPLIQTLDLRTYSMIEIPHDMFTKSRRLKHLYLSFFTCGLERKLQLSGLCELETFVVGDSISQVELSGLLKLTNIRYFKAKIYSTTSYDELSLMIDHMASWKKIKQLEIGMWRLEDEMASKVFMGRNTTDLMLSQISFIKASNYEVSFCKDLIHLEIYSCKHADDELLEFIGKIPNLRMLSYKNIQNVTKINFNQDSFCQLRYLELDYCLDLEKLLVTKGSLPNLIKLKVARCRKLELAPVDGLRYLYNLEELEISDMRDFVEICRRHHSCYAHITIKKVQW